MKKYFENQIIINYIAVSIFIELFANIYTDATPILTSPLYPLLILSTIVLIISLTPKNIIRIILSTVLLITQIILNTLFIFLYDSNGTVFEWAMYNQRNDATGTLETFDLQYAYIFITLISVILFIVVTIINHKKHCPLKAKVTKKQYLFSIIAIIVLTATIIYVPYYEAKKEEEKGYQSRLYSKTRSNYQRIGITGNTVYQLVKGDYVVDASNIDKLEEFIYKEKIDISSYNGISAGNNLVMILVESLEWYPITLYQEYSKDLYPNLTRLINDGLIGTSFYQKEKTDVSEALSILGNYPTGKYINYDFAENLYPFSLPNLLRNSNNNMSINSFHANYGDFYNRYNLHKSMGFEKLYGINEMNEYGVMDTWQHKKGERNLDSITFDKMKDVMFPKNKNYFSYIISFSMHGYYGTRKTLEPYYEKIDKHINFDLNDQNNIYLRTYMAALMDFDKAMGIMLDKLEENNDLDNTTIVLFSDHNTYYNSLSNYAKKIDEKYNAELYHIPLIIYDEKLTKEYQKNNNTNQITKFTTTADIVPTILDIMDIEGYKNLYFGSSVFTDNESIVYSRNYNIFVAKDFIGYSLNVPLYEGESLTKDDLKDIENRALIHLEKLQNIDKIYYQDYFKKNQYKNN